MAEKQLDFMLLVTGLAGLTLKMKFRQVFLKIQREPRNVQPVVLSMETRRVAL